MKELSLIKEPGKMNLNHSGKVTLSRLVKVEDIKTRKEFEELFPLIPSNFEKIKRRMEAYGYDNSQPVHLWEAEGKAVLIDGHHRLLAAKELGITEIPGYFHSFENLEEAVEYAIALQIERRNLSDAEILIMIKVVDQLKVRGKGASGEKGKSAKRTAEILGTNTSKIEKARIVEKYGNEEIKGKVASGELSLNQAYLEARMAREQRIDGEESGDGSGEGYTEETGTDESTGYDLSPLLPEPDSKSDSDDNSDTTTNYDTSQTVCFLKTAVLVLRENQEDNAINLLINHFLREKEQAAFYALLPERREYNADNL
jgi:ParB family chromosome partitioning protein